MTGIASTSTSTNTEISAGARAARPAVWRAGLLSGVVASAATTLIVVAARAADIPVDVDGEEIPLIGFAQLTMVGALIGIALAAILARTVPHPRRTFVVTTVVLTALSIVPDVLIDASVGTKLTLIATHLVAAAIIVPALAGRLRADA